MKTQLRISREARSWLFAPLLVASRKLIVSRLVYFEGRVHDQARTKALPFVKTNHDVVIRGQEAMALLREMVAPVPNRLMRGVVAISIAIVVALAATSSTIVLVVDAADCAFVGVSACLFLGTDEQPDGCRPGCRFTFKRNENRWGVNDCNTCTKCAAGQTTTGGPQDDTCDDCPAGRANNDPGSDCTECSAGMFAAEGATVCTQCPAGSISAAG